MKIVHLSTSDSGGAGIAASRIHQSLLDLGHDSSFLSLYRFRADIRNAFSYDELNLERLNLLGKIIRKTKRVSRRLNFTEDPYKQRDRKFLTGRPGGFELFTLPFSELDIASLDIIQQADIINLHWVTEGFVGYKTFFPSVANKRIVWTLHDMNPFTGGCHHSDDSIGYMTDCTSCPQLKGTLNENLAAENLAEKKNALSSMPDKNMHIVGPSKWILEKSKQSALFGRFSHHHIVNPVSKNFTLKDQLSSRQHLQLPADKKIFLFIAKDIDNPRKGTKYLTSALQQLSDDYLLCSVGNPAGITFLNHQALGYVNDEERMSMIYSAADAFILPSLAENLPNTISESLVCGTPVIAFNVGGIPEMIDAKNGILVPYRDAGLLASAMKRIISNEIVFDRKVISENARKKYSSQIAGVSYSKLYSEMMSQ